jgi:hypothetical protein
VPIDHLPPRIRHPAKQARDFLLTDGAVLLLVGTCLLIRGAAYLLNQPPAHPAERFLPMPAWAAVWMVVGVANLACARWHESVAGAGAISVAVGLMALWAASMAVAGAVGSAAVYAAIALGTVWSIWRGSRTTIRVEEGSR